VCNARWDSASKKTAVEKKVEVKKPELEKPLTT